MVAGWIKWECVTRASILGRLPVVTLTADPQIFARASTHQLLSSHPLNFQLSIRHQPAVIIYGEIQTKWGCWHMFLFVCISRWNIDYEWQREARSIRRNNISQNGAETLIRRWRTTIWKTARHQVSLLLPGAIQMWAENESSSIIVWMADGLINVMEIPMLFTPPQSRLLPCLSITELTGGRGWWSVEWSRQHVLLHVCRCVQDPLVYSEASWHNMHENIHITS